MKLPVLVFLALLAFYCTTAKPSLTKSDAQKQIGAYIEHQISDAFYVKKSVDRHNIPDNYVALKKAGFIDFVSSNPDDKNLRVKLLSKGHERLVKDESDKYYFKAPVVQGNFVSKRGWRRLPGNVPGKNSF